MNKKEARREALRASEGVQLPDGWVAVPSHPPTFSCYRYNAVRGLGISFSALGTSPGSIEVSCCGMTILTSIENLPKAVEHVLAWIDVVKPGN